jgi:hypothetical protein
MMALLRGVLVCVLALMLCTGGALARNGKLDSFEKDAAAADKVPPDDDPSWNDTNDPGHHHHHHHHHDEVSAPTVILVETSTSSSSNSGDCSASTPLFSLDDLGHRPHRPSYLRLDLAFRNLEPTIHAYDVRAEVGKGDWAAQYNQMDFKESFPTDTLVIREFSGVYRVVDTGILHVDLGVGQLRMNGSSLLRETGFVFPILYRDPDSPWSVEFRPFVADSITDYDLGALYNHGRVALKAGYRWVNSPHVSLSGVYVGTVWRL